MLLWLYGKTAGEIHECQTSGKCSIIQAEIALLTLMPFPLWSQGSCWVVAPDGLLKDLTVRTGFFNEHCCACCFPTGHRCMAFQGRGPFVCLLLQDAVCTQRLPQCPDVNMQLGREKQESVKWSDLPVARMLLLFLWLTFHLALGNYYSGGNNGAYLNQIGGLPLSLYSYLILHIRLIHPLISSPVSTIVPPWLLK